MLLVYMQIPKDASPPLSLPTSTQKLKPPYKTIKHRTNESVISCHTCSRPHLVLVSRVVGVEEVAGGVLVQEGDWVVHLDIPMVQDIDQVLLLGGHCRPWGPVEHVVQHFTLIVKRG